MPSQLKPAQLDPGQPDQGSAASNLTIDLDALGRNWRAANAASGNAVAAGVVKADGYGLGIAPVATALALAGCTDFFVALPEEGLAVRAIAPDATIYVLNGPTPQTAGDMAQAGLVPVLNNPSQITTWAGVCAEAGAKLDAAVHLDTGMHRLGLSRDQLASLTADRGLMDAFSLRLVMSHLACADDPSHPMNDSQRRTFDDMRKLLGDAPASLSNSAGIFLGEPYHYDITRAGICLYGASPFIARPAPFERVATATAQIIQAQAVPAGSTIGYGATFTAPRAMRTVTIAAGYADGLFRSLGNTGVATLNGIRVPYVGRVSMDLVVLDVSALDPADTQPGAMVELIGDHVTVDEVANAAGTIGYEVLTSLGSRYQKRYISDGIVSLSGPSLATPPHA